MSGRRFAPPLVANRFDGGVRAGLAAERLQEWGQRERTCRHAGRISQNTRVHLLVQHADSGLCLVIWILEKVSPTLALPSHFHTRYFSMMRYPPLLAVIRPRHSVIGVGWAVSLGSGPVSLG